MRFGATKRQRQQRRGWIIPCIYVLVTIIVGVVLPRIEHHLLPGWASSMSPSAAISICSAIASGMIALTGIVFSLAFVMVQFSATAYSPRLVLWVARDPVVSHSLGVFSATVLDALVLGGWVDRYASGRVPLISSLLVFALLLASMGIFVALIERIGRLQVNRMLIFTGDWGRKSIAALYPAERVAVGSQPDDGDYRRAAAKQTLTHMGRPQAIQAVHIPTLVRLATQSDAVIEVAAAVGDTILEMTPLLRVYGSGHALSEQMLREAVEIGDERTFEQDAKYALRLIVDIAIKALSPAINDPTTAVQALDQIEDLLLRLGRGHLEIGKYRDNKGALRLIVPFPTWDDYLRLGLDEIRFCGANSVQVMRRMKALIKNLTAILPAERQAALLNWERRLLDTVRRTFADAQEKEEASVPDRQGLGISDEKLGSD